MKATIYRDMTVLELEARAMELRQSLFNLRTRAATKELENVARIRLEKRELARVLTIVQEKQQSQATAD